MKVMRNHPTALTRQIKESGIGQEIGQYPQELKGGVKFRVEMRKRRRKWSQSGVMGCPTVPVRYKPKAKRRVVEEAREEMQGIASSKRMKVGDIPFFN